MNDRLVPVENSFLMASALRQNNIPCEAHLLQEGGHGFGLGSADQPGGLWPDLFVRWMRRLALLS